VLGDSFTWGATADIGQSWVEIVSHELEADNVLVWNTGVPGTGTKQALANAQRFMPVMKPNLVILGFYVNNDFWDNLYPLDYYSLVAVPDDGENDRQVFVPQYKFNHNWEPIPLSSQEIRYSALNVEFYPQNGVEYFLGLSRIGSLLVQANDSIAQLRREQQGHERSYDETQHLIVELSEYVAANDAKFLVLIIPHYNDLQTLGDQYLVIQQILSESNVDFVEPINNLELRDYVETQGDDHWNNSGHNKVAGFMLDCLSLIINQADATCAK